MLGGGEGGFGRIDLSGGYCPLGGEQAVIQGKKRIARFDGLSFGDKHILDLASHLR